MINRTFQEIPDGKIEEAYEPSLLVSLGWSHGQTWDDLLRSKRVLIISEAGAGKTYECRAEAQRLWDSGEPAFFIELASLASENLFDLLDRNEEERLNAWLASQSDVATFFLDSIDELKLSTGTFERALKRLRKAVDGHLHKTRIVITTRPAPIDEQLIRKILPFPSRSQSELGEESFAEIAMGEHEERWNNREENEPPILKVVGLMPLSDQQILEFANGQGVENAEDLQDDIRRRNAQDFARRPQDLIELCADWREHKRIRTHREQVESNIRVKLLPREDRREAAELSIDKAIEGASRLALAMQVTRRFTIRHSAASDTNGHEATIDPADILSDWNPNEIKALLERPMFGFSSYGRVRFHHRSVAEFLAAKRQATLRKQGVMPFKALRRLLFAETKGKIIVRPSKRPLAGWLALKSDGIYELLRDHEPAVLLDEGDPQSLTLTQRKEAIRAYCKRFGASGWRGHHVPHIQVHRLASTELADEINKIWREGVSNPEVREFLLNLIEAGQIDACAEVVHRVAWDVQASERERLIALNALVAIKDDRAFEVAAVIAAGDESWPNPIARSAILSLFPDFMSVEQCCQSLGWLKPRKQSLDQLTWQLPRLISTLDIDYPLLSGLRKGLETLVSEGLRWDDDRSRFTSNQSHLKGALAATCVRGLEHQCNDEWFHASLLALNLCHSEDRQEETTKQLRERLNGMSASDTSRLFWINDALIQLLRVASSPWERFRNIALYDAVVRLTPERDLPWVSKMLADKSRSTADRALLLETAISLNPVREQRKEHGETLKPLVADTPSLVKTIEDWLKPSKYEKETRRWEAEQAKRLRKEERRKAKDRASWIQFWREVANHPETAFSSDKANDTAWNLWHAMRHDVDSSQSSGWNRRFIEEQFNKETADKLREVLMAVWRNDSPTLPSERPTHERHTYLADWKLGLAAIYAEAEDPGWVTNLNGKEARLASRYTQFDHRGFPTWLDSLSDAFPSEVEQTLGNELSWELNQTPRLNDYSHLLHATNNASEKVARLFIPPLLSWLSEKGDLAFDAVSATAMAQRVEKVTGIILKHGDDPSIAHLLDVAKHRLAQELPSELYDVWLPTQMRIDPVSGVTLLEDQLATVEVGKLTRAVNWIANFFGDRHGSVNLDGEGFTPPLLLRVLRLAYQHVRIVDDVTHEGCFTPDSRDNAQSARNNILRALLNAKGEEAWSTKLKMLNDPLFEHFKDRILAISEENWALEIDSEVFDVSQAIALDRTGEAAATTNKAMFTILKDRLSDLEELLLTDASPREAWAGISSERVMRREIARELNHAANSLYTVVQESVTADEKETDIRLQSLASEYEAVIELKLADERSARDLRDTIENQLVKKYLAPEYRRSGALLFTISKDKHWQHPVDGSRINVEELLTLLRNEANSVQEKIGNAVSLTVHFLDLRPRLPLEKDTKSKPAES